MMQHECQQLRMDIGCSSFLVSSDIQLHAAFFEQLVTALINAHIVGTAVNQILQL